MKENNIPTIQAQESMDGRYVVYVTLVINMKYLCDKLFRMSFLLSH